MKINTNNAKNAALSEPSMANYLINKLQSLEAALHEINRRESDGVNIFYAVGMNRQEVKHSAFLAWLLSPSESHGLGCYFLKSFLQSVSCYSNSVSPKKHNEELFKHGNISTFSDLDEFFASKDITVETEKIFIDPKSRIDIFIESQKSKTAIIIENKTFTENHDNQLSRYIEEFKKYKGNADYSAYKKIFIYLTPKGDLPSELGLTAEQVADNDKWCIFDYKEILKIVRAFLSDKFSGKAARTEERLKVKFLLEDYEKMTYREILKENRELRQLCKKILREHSEALQLLHDYTDNANEVINFSIAQLSNLIPDLVQIDSVNTHTHFEFYTKELERIFALGGEQILIDGQAVCRCILSSRKGDITLSLSMQKLSTDWSNVQKKISQSQGSKKLGDKYLTLGKVILLKEDLRADNFDENYRSKVNSQLIKFVTYLKEFLKSIK